MEKIFRAGVNDLHTIAGDKVKGTWARVLQSDGRKKDDSVGMWRVFKTHMVQPLDPI